MKKNLFFSLVILNTPPIITGDINLDLLPIQIKDYCKKYPSDSRVKNLIVMLANQTDSLEIKRLKIFQAARLLTDAMMISTKDAADATHELTKPDSQFLAIKMDVKPAKLHARPLIQPESTLSNPGPASAAQLLASNLLTHARRYRSLEEFTWDPLEKYMRKERFKDVVGGVPQEIKDIGCLLSGDKHYIATGAKKYFSILLYGPPGTGKSLLIKAVAGEYGIPIIFKSGSEFINKYVGTGAAEIRSLFLEGLSLLSHPIKPASHIIIAIDELDAIGGKRNSEGNDEANRTITQIMTILDGLSGIKIDKEKVTFMATTNRVDMLDDALIRAGRIDKKIEIKNPDNNKREAILDFYFRTHTRKIEEPIDIKKHALATDGFNCADLENLVNEAALIAARNKRGIMNKDFDDVIKSIKDTRSTAMSEDAKRMYG